MWILSLLILAATIFAIVDIVLRDEDAIKHLPKIAWLFLVILIPVLGTILWFTLGREWPERAPRPQPRPASAPVVPPAARAGAAGDPRSTEQQLADLEREIEEDRLRAELARRRRDQKDAGPDAS
ncbi:hypothetical protein LK09_06000 [Microbacterium mangrovi]|uniref:Cardiolipin synthase N-terminal domain-containing protein n=1 Tax=Microbacterium mangrovi TaxID=1348253 RepID=A0A0B2AB20_9MICO|nr:PLD nuclease N-terminal domain-containing protein [Microbacterium mangrovi]KHK98998.1 hypothetical protein LK09_06000 [Microbacterium mangrovi]